MHSLHRHSTSTIHCSVQCFSCINCISLHPVVLFCVSVYCQSSAVKSRLLTAFLQQHVERKQVEEGLEDTLRYQQLAVPLDNRIVRQKRKRKRKAGRDPTRHFRHSRLLKIDDQAAV